MLIRAMVRLTGARASEKERGRRGIFVASSRFRPAATERSQQPKGGRPLRAVR